MIYMVSEFFQEHIDITGKMKQDIEKIKKIADVLRNSLNNSGKIVICGNGGSAADAQHFAAELVGRYKKERKALPAIALNTDTSILTALGNDYGFEEIFLRQIDAHCKKGDVVVILSTSGNSKNIINAAKKAREVGAIVIGLLGRDGGVVKSLCDFEITVHSNNISRIQEMHILIIHILCELIE